MTRPYPDDIPRDSLSGRLRHRYVRTGRPWRDFHAHIYRWVHGHYDAENNPTVRHRKVR